MGRRVVQVNVSRADIRKGYAITVDGVRYFWSGSQFIDSRGASADFDVNWLIASNASTLYVPREMAGRPQRLWSRPNTSGQFASSVFVEQIRTVRVGLYAAVNQSYTVPIVDSEEVPYLGPEVPPMVVIRHAADETSTDLIDAYDTVDVDWYDEHVGVRSAPVAALGGIEWSLERARDPMPHWNFVLHRHFVSGSITLMVDLVGQGSGAHSSSYVESGSAGTTGHWRVDHTFSGQAQNYMTAGLASRLNERRLVRGSMNTTAGITTTHTYLTDTQLSGGANLFAYPPCVRVLGHADIGVANLVASSADTAWIPSSRGLGFTSGSVGYVDSSGTPYRFFSVLRNDSISGKYRLALHNNGLIATTHDRTFFFFAFGIG